MTSTIWITIAGCTVITALIKAFGPVLLGGRTLPPRVTGVIVLMAPALLAALVVTSVLAVDGRWHVGPQTAGVAAAAVVLVRRGPLVLAVVLAMAVTALIRLVA